jgi:hypothetical protein
MGGKKFPPILVCNTPILGYRYLACTQLQEGKMKQNITLSIEKEILRKGKLIAAQNDTSISKMLSDHLKQIVDKEEQHETAKQSALHTLKKGFHLGGKINWRREDLYGR